MEQIVEAEAEEEKIEMFEYKMSLSEQADNSDKEESDEEPEFC